MQVNRFRFLALASLLAVAASVGASVLDRPAGIVIGQRLTLRPYVDASVTFDSNPDSRHSDKKEDVMWTVSPGLGVAYNHENWSVLLDAFYNYRAYCRNTSTSYNNNNRHSFGENLRWNWSNSKGTEKGWSLMLGENFEQINMADDMALSDGRSYNADRRQFQVNGAAQRRFNDHWHSDLNAGYYMLDYDNDTSSGSSSSLYGWQRFHVGLDAGFAPSPWTDIIAALGYQGYSQENAQGSTSDSTSQGITAQAGIGSYMTDRISYRLLAGWSRFDYGGGSSTANGFVYTASGNWKIGETWNTMLLATSYYQPSEREYNSASRVDAISWGLAKSMVRGKLRGTLDFRYRRETQDHVNSSSSDYAIDVITGRIGLSYTLNRIFSFFAYGEYQRSWNSEAEAYNYSNDYDRWRITGGVRLTY